MADTKPKKGANQRKDFTQTALDVVRKATGEATAPAPAKKAEDGRTAVPAKKKPKP